MPSLVSDFTSSAITLSRAASKALRTSSIDAVFLTMRIAILPGRFDPALDLWGPAASGRRAAEGAVVVVGPTAQLAVGTEVAWEQCNRTQKPRLVVVNKLDKENSDFYGAVAAMRETLSPRPFPLHLPIGAEQDFRGIVDLLHMKAFVTADDGKGSEVAIPDDRKQRGDE